MILLAVVSLLVAALTWIAWIRVGAGLVYDLHKVPGPPAWPLIGNLNKIAGSSYLHKVGAASPTIRFLHRGVRSRRRPRFGGLYRPDYFGLLHTCRARSNMY